MITDFEMNTVYFSDRLSREERYEKTFDEIVKALRKVGVEPKLLPKTKDIWARDYMPIQVDEKTFIEYRYDPDYLQGEFKGYRDLKTYPDMVCDAIGRKTVKSDIILDGGNVVQHKDCAILVDKVVRENRLSYTKEELIKKLKDTFQVNQIILIPWHKPEYLGHADGVLRFINEKTVLLGHHNKTDSVMLYRLQSAGLNVQFLDFKVKKNSKHNWAYINFLQMKDVILLPKFGADEDQQAFNQIEHWYPQYAGKIIQIDTSEIVRGGGALNCISWTTKE